MADARRENHGWICLRMPSQPTSGNCAKSASAAHGTVAGGWFDVTVTRVGSLVNGSCVVASSRVAGTATLDVP